ncbi:SulP family inorganic anion transporter [Phenylobacterium sp.]|uniref:SulP family inorganic anion transporter n=1 Tax=Phenylobacterium sp. TaxID=1871053 RepID=UPI00271837EE|nr:SulP family inorganic anion transporter [Phenylobacterium sp.]MDO8378968.1 SulP family inorganic anion transporter [Phenylobacterium sp.]
MTEAAQPRFTGVFTPKLATIFAEGYSLKDLRADAIAGLTVAIVALPLSMGIAIASGVSPDRGLYSAIVGGFLVSALGGSRFQIGGPAGAFIVLVAATVAKQGIDGLVLATFLSGLMLTLGGFLRLGALIRYVPHAVTVGFTAAIATIITASQLKDLFGLRLAGGEPGEFGPKIVALTRALPSTNAQALAVGAACILIAFAVRRWRPAWPALLIGVVIATAAAALMHLDVETIGSRFGGIPSGLPMPHLPAVTMEKLLAVLPAAAAFTLLGGIESLLSATVADGMSGRQHRSNIELVAQGAGNMGAALFGGICVTGTIARTATNVRAGAKGPVAGMLHSLFLLGFMMLAAPLAAYVPLAALAGMLVVVGWNMAEKAEFARLARLSWRTAAVLLATFGLTLARDLITGITAGCLLATLFAAEAWFRRRRA